jgi:hypothetical protein
MKRELSGEVKDAMENESDAVVGITFFIICTEKAIWQQIYQYTRGSVYVFG